MDVIDGMWPVVAEGSSLSDVSLFVDEELAGRCVGAKLAFSERSLFVWVDGMDDTIGASEAIPPLLLEASIRSAPAPASWRLAVGHPILWAWAMTNTQRYVDGIQIEFGTASHPSVTLQMLARASMIVARVIAAGGDVPISSRHM
jgi:hypothetical protein